MAGGRGRGRDGRGGMMGQRGRGRCFDYIFVLYITINDRLDYEPSYELSRVQLSWEYG